MKANKRTVWFLTLISLVAVISIYYVNNKSLMPFDGLAIFGDKTPDSGTVKDNATDKQAPVFAESYIFDDMRMTVRNERSERNTQLSMKVGSSDFTSVEKSDALDEMAALVKLNSIEALMEMQIIALGYPDAFVQTEGGKVNVRVLAIEGQSTKQADEITHLVMTTWEEAKNVSVKFETGS